MLLQEFDYNLPAELIAQEPAPMRDASRLLVLDRGDETITETLFSRITALFRPGDLLVLNDTRVIPARLEGRKESGGHVEVFLVRRLTAPGETWHCLLRCSKPARPGLAILMNEGVTAHVLERAEGNTWAVRFTPAEGFEAWVERTGSMPLPPYIKRQARKQDSERYQTVFAKVRGAVAAPTAGLHMTPELLREIEAVGTGTTSITLHTGLGTFMPVRVENLREHRMHREYFNIPEASANAIAETRRRGGRIIALGTTVCRALEQAAHADGTIPSGEGEADIFIYPGYRFRAVDALITNFHLPKSTLLMLVSALAGKDFLFRAYGEAVTRRFRFFSYGDAMFIQ